MPSSTSPENHDMYVMRECVKAWLIEVRLRLFEQRELSERIREMGHRLDGLASATCDGVRAGASSPGLHDGMAKLMDMRREWSEMVSQDEAFVRYAMDACRPRNVERYACWLAWARGLSWNKVADRLNFSEAYVKGELKDKGVAELYKVMPEEFRRYTFPNAAPI